MLYSVYNKPPPSISATSSAVVRFDSVIWEWKLFCVIVVNLFIALLKISQIFCVNSKWLGLVVVRLAFPGNLVYNTKAKNVERFACEIKVIKKVYIQILLLFRKRRIYEMEGYFHFVFRILTMPLCLVLCSLVLWFTEKMVSIKMEIYFWILGRGTASTINLYGKLICDP